MAELITGPDGAVVDGVLRLGADGIVTAAGYEVTTTRTNRGLRYDVLTPTGEQLSWTAPLAAQRTLVLGGARSGKSTEAERLLADYPDTLYVATGGDGSADPEWAERIALHRARRPASWGLAETVDLVPLLETPGPPLLIDCLTLWLSRTMDACEVWADHSRAVEVEKRIELLAEAWSRTTRLVVAVSNEVGSGVVPADAGTRLYRDLMGRVNATVARRSETVLWCVAGRTVAL
ncbi:bifunctional adenosylcobinamide kinase/adenosylcobinamide-phosphate guanylyltransferase [Streptomyces sp. SID13031]|uniref:bifunctional adenosylcobinamide kinase/adenosylcobinamide-phosphate guanylyltransferase n=1 Tax=Streptomyces sp. SID13031 TaxID=2706046 RepID=UPI0013CDD0D6|nr:bifunctional adenosylcobinamide kinase/adenosylcobinamide-phosphate guanylyltransferase [Streptomyces sp. SID13031]NEA33654.1 bifunctional adenosylcobinamide kinase/adenosylcobinamide-phosphate guanylyltransferase [Streptomyces sp. SID13031]